ncbi:MAG: ABC transporter substrate-binding protein [Eubacteriales bacterium]|nr:ABC transporter substrate-binding protein [Eubacteriales bacterium]
MKKIISFIMACILSVSLMACGNTGSQQTKQEDNGKKPLSITVSGINGSVNFTPIYIALEKGFFSKENLDVKYVLFDNGPVQMEALASNSWDLGFTGIGGVLSGLISYNATLVGATNTDNGTQTMWVRPDSAIAKVGAGKNKVNDQIIGDAESWKGATVLCNSGTVLEYLLIKTLQGFDLKSSDVNIITMDSPTANSAFLAGQGDSSVITGAISFAEDKKNYVMASCGNWANTGLECSIIANTKSYEDKEKYEAMVRFLKVYWDTVEWMGQNKEDAAKLCSDFNAECGITLAPETAGLYLKQDPYYSAAEVLEAMNTKSSKGDYSVMEEKLIDILNFFVASKKYKEGDDQKLLKHLDVKLMTDVNKELGK